MKPCALLLLLFLSGCSVHFHTGPVEVRQCPQGWPKDVFDKIDSLKTEVGLCPK